MPVLKNQTFRPASKDAVVLDLGDLSRQAAKLRAIAESKAERILAEARARADELTSHAAQLGDERGYAEGLERGLQEGLERGRSEAIAEHTETLTTLTSQWTEAIERFDGARDALEAEATASALRLAVRLAEMVVHRCVDEDDQTAVRQVRAALERVLEPAAVKVRICPDDRAAVEAGLPEITAQLDRVRGVELVDDPAVGRGGCVVASGAGRIDATVETQLRRLCEHLLGEGAVDEPPDASTPDPDQTEPHEPNKPTDVA